MEIRVKKLGFRSWFQPRVPLPILKHDLFRNPVLIVGSLSSSLCQLALLKNQCNADHHPSSVSDIEKNGPFHLR